MVKVVNIKQIMALVVVRNLAMAYLSPSFKNLPDLTGWVESHPPGVQAVALVGASQCATFISCLPTLSSDSSPPPPHQAKQRGVPPTTRDRALSALLSSPQQHAAQAHRTGCCSEARALHPGPAAAAQPSYDSYILLQ